MKKMKASVTVEAAVIVPLFLGVFALLILLLFYFHDKNVVAAIMHETIALHSIEKEVEEEDVESYARRRIRGKLLLFAGVSPIAGVEDDCITLQCTARRKRFSISIELKMCRTEPESYIRKLKRIEEIGGRIGQE